jgi:hypothetical protein
MENQNRKMEEMSPGKNGKWNNHKASVKRTTGPIGNPEDLYDSMPAGVRCHERGCVK